MINEPMRWRPRVTVLPTLEGWGLAVIASCLLISSFIQRVNLLVLVFGLLVAILLTGLFVARRNLARLGARRQPPGHAFVGKPLDVTIEVANRGKSDTLAATVEDGNDLPDAPPFEVVLLRVRKQTTAKTKYTFTPARRGRVTLGPLTLLTRFPFGLFTARRTTDSFAELVVVPAIGGMTDAWRRSTGRSSDAARNLRPSVDRMIEEFHGLRDYREGDNVRHIHWLSTARRGQPVVKEFETLSARDMVLIVDPRVEFADFDEHAELALSFAATACIDLGVRIGALGGRIVMAIAGPEPNVIQGQASPRLVDAALRALGLAEYSSDGDWRSALDQLGPNQCRNAQAWFIGTRPMDDLRREYAARFGYRAGADAIHVNLSADEHRPYFTPPKSSAAV